MQSKHFIIPALSLLALSSCSRPLTDRQEVVQQQYIHKYGLTLTEEGWQARGKSGKVVSTRKDGVTVEENFQNGKHDGDTTYSFPHTQVVEKTETYQDGKLNRHISHYLSGTPEEEVHYNDDNSKSVKVWYEGGSPQLTETYENELLVEGEYYTIDNQLESRVSGGAGERIRRDKYGTLISRDQIHDGEMTTRTTFHQNGNPKEFIPYRNQIVEGKRKTFYPDGEPDQIEEWRNGSQDGTTVVFRNGEKVSEATYINGVKHGVEKRFRNNGTRLVEEVTWSEGHKHGPFITYLGDEARIDWYHYGKQVNKSAFDRLNKHSTHAKN